LFISTSFFFFFEQYKWRPKLDGIAFNSLSLEEAA